MSSFRFNLILWVPCWRVLLYFRYAFSPDSSYTYSTGVYILQNTMVGGGGGCKGKKWILGMWGENEKEGKRGKGKIIKPVKNGLKTA